MPRAAAAGVLAPQAGGRLLVGAAQTPNQALQQTAGHEGVFQIRSSLWPPAAAELGRSAASEVRQVVACCLWFPDVGGPLDAVHLTDLEPDEWAGLAAWAGSRAAELPALAGLLSAPLPVRVPPAGMPPLDAECGRVDWDTLAGPAINGFAALSLVVSQAAGQAGAGLRFAPDAEPSAAADGGGT